MGKDYRKKEHFDKKYELSPHTVLKGRYVIESSLKMGGFGITYLALDTEQQITVAIKEMFLREISNREQGLAIYIDEEDQCCYEESKKRFLNEARILEMLCNDDTLGIVAVLDYFEENNTAYIVMEYLEGETLKEKVKKKALSFSETMELMGPVANSLSKIHKRKIVHLDISPDNIMILHDGKAKLLDFGVAKNIGHKDSSGQLLFKKGYAPLEQRRASGQIGEWTDVFSFAATIYYCLTGKKPEDIWERMVGVDLEPPSSVGVSLPVIAEEAIMKALELDSSKRFQTVDDFWRALNTNDD